MKQKKRAKILIADDNRDNRLLLNDFIVSINHEPILVDNGKRALEYIRKEKPDLMLLDIMMPVMDGFEVLQTLKEDESLRSIPVVIISAIDDMDNVAKCIELGADDYLFKPFQPTILNARIQAILQKKQQADREKELYNELQQSYQTLKESEKARDGLVHMVVHDLKGPLTVIKGYTELMLMNVPKDESVYKLLQNLYTGVNELHYMISSILDVSKLESGELKLNLATIEVSNFAERVYTDYKNRFDSEGIPLKFSKMVGDTNIHVDANILSRILHNLLTNALKYTAKKRDVVFTVEEQDNHVLFSVRDNGPGVKPEHIDKIFDKFFQVNHKKTGGKYGVGLGLNFCKIAAEALGGRIWVESEGDNTGSQFFVAIPISVD